MIRKILGRVVLLLILCQSALLYAGSVYASVDNEEVSVGESVILTISMIGEDIQTLPDIPYIAGVRVLNSSRRNGTSLTTINGKAKMLTTESLILEFRAEHNMTIPSFQIEIDGVIKFSKPINIHVIKGKKRASLSKNFAIEMKLNKSGVYVGEPLVAVIKFRQKISINVLDISYKEPKFKGFFKRLIGTQKNYNKGKYTYMELRYLLIAKVEGNITIDPARVEVSQSNNKKEFGGYFSDAPKVSKVISDSPVVKVLKPRTEYDIIGDYKLKDSVDTIEVKANKPLNLKIEIDGEGSLEDYEGVVFDIDDVTVYGDGAIIESKVVDGKLLSHFAKSFVFIANSDFIIPSQTIRVYNYKTKKIDILRTKEHLVKVIGASKEATHPTVYTKDNIDQNSNSSYQIQAKGHSITWNIPDWSMLAGASVLGMIFTLIMQKIFSFSFFRFRPKFGKDIDEALRILYPKMNESRVIEDMVRDLYAKRQGEKVKIDKNKLKRLIELYRPKEETPL